MQVVIGNRTWEMGQQQFKGLLHVASEQVPFGIYAVVRQGYAELCNHKCTSTSQLKALIRQYKSKGYKVYYNGK